ncbi:MAG: hypothetical protein FD135_817 [Comamonadaceae bacterium]|nr:MAG: hypothetical protein FD135_817 [Comamonadaceae bacterium]
MQWLGDSGLVGASAGASCGFAENLLTHQQPQIMRMDGAACPSEVHDFDEALLVISGVMKLARLSVEAGDLIIVTAGQAHAVTPGSYGSLMIVDR